MSFFSYMFTRVSLFVVASRTANAVQLRASEAGDADARARDAGASKKDLANWGIEARLELHLMRDKGAFCLDGSDAGFYFAPASDFGLDNKNINDWQIAFEGGGWCYREQECIEKASTGRGSSNGYTQHYNGFRTLGGFMSDDCTINPTFCQYNKVLVVNCDGTSFTGDQYEPVEATDKNGMPYTLHFRGARILPAVLDALLTMGLQDANDVVLTGYSSGGLSTLLHADYVRKRVKASAPKLRKFRAVPISGFFLDHMSQATESGELVDAESKIYNTEFENLVVMANSTGALNKRCVETFRDWGKAWKCFFAPNAYRHLQTPTFIINSGIDEWQISFVKPVVQVLSSFRNITNGNYTKAINSWRTCFLSDGFEDCSEIQIQDLVQFHNDFEQLLWGSARLLGDGAFVHSCPLHDEALDDDNWNDLTVGGLSIQEAVTNWWKSDRESATTMHTTLDCHLDATASVHTCNPSCSGRIDHSN